MRLLLRANAHRPVTLDGAEVGVEVAASPDTPTRPDRWAWHIRLLHDRAALDVVPEDSPAGAAAHPVDGTAIATTRVTTRMAFPSGGRGTLEVEVDPRLVGVETEVVSGTDVVLERPKEELLALVASSGEVVLEQRHRLAAGDAIVLTGDDPLSVDLSTTHGCAVVIRLREPHGRPVTWVP